MKFDDILEVVEESEYFYLVIEQCSVDVPFDIFHIDEF